MALEDVLHHFSNEDVGDGLKEYSCAYVKHAPLLIQGTLYLTTKCICFYANLVAYEEKLILPLSELVMLEKKTTAFIVDNAILISSTEMYSSCHVIYS